MRIYAPDILNASMYRAVEFKVAEHPFSVDRSRITVYLSKAQLAELFAQVDAEESAERGDMVDDNSPSARMAAIWDKPVTPDDAPSVQHEPTEAYLDTVQEEDHKTEAWLDCDPIDVSADR